METITFQPGHSTQNGHKFEIETFYTDRCKKCGYVRSILDNPSEPSNVPECEFGQTS